MSTAAVAMRTTMFERRTAARGGSSGLVASATSIGDLLWPRAEATDAPLVGGDRLIEVGVGEIGPERLGAVELGVRRLPEQEIAESHLAGGADHEVRIGQPPCVEMTRQAGIVEGGQVRALSRQFSDGVDDLLPAAVVYRNIEDRFGADPGSFAGLSHLVLERGRKLLQPDGVRTRTPRRSAASATRRMVSMPALCPMTRGSRRSRAQRLLPSMMIATCSGGGNWLTRGSWASDLHDLGFLAGGHLVDQTDVAINDPLQLVAPAPRLVGRDLLLF